MISVYYARDGDAHELTISGHAGYAEHGHDIVCAGVSALAFALLGYLEEYEDEVEELDGPIVENGSVYISCKGNENIATAFQVVVGGLKQISNSYSDYVEIQIVPQGE